MSAPGHRARGFTLIEMLAALAVLAMVAMIGAPLGLRALDGMELRSSARKLAAALAETRARAIGAGRPAVLTLDAAPPGYRIADGPGVALPRGVALVARGAAEIADPAPDGSGAAALRIAFFPDGSSTGGSVVLRRDGTAWHIAVDWLTGTIETRRHAP